MLFLLLSLVCLIVTEGSGSWNFLEAKHQKTSSWRSMDKGLDGGLRIMEYIPGPERGREAKGPSRISDALSQQTHARRPYTASVQHNVDQMSQYKETSSNRDYVPASPVGLDRTDAMPWNTYQGQFVVTPSVPTTGKKRRIPSSMHKVPQDEPYNHGLRYPKRRCTGTPSSPPAAQAWGRSTLNSSKVVSVPEVQPEEENILLPSISTLLADVGINDEGLGLGREGELALPRPRIRREALPAESWLKLRRRASPEAGGYFFGLGWEPAKMNWNHVLSNFQIIGSGLSYDGRYLVHTSRGLLVGADTRSMLLYASDFDGLGMYGLQKARNAIEQHLDVARETDLWATILLDFGGLSGANLVNLVGDHVRISKTRRDEIGVVLLGRNQRYQILHNSRDLFLEANSLVGGLLCIIKAFEGGRLEVLAGILGSNLQGNLVLAEDVTRMLRIGEVVVCAQVVPSHPPWEAQ